MLGEAVLDRKTFDRLVQEGLSHLYDHAYLQLHPLAGLLLTESGRDGPEPTLHRVLMEAIEELKPERDVPYRSLAGRKYRYVFLRYVSGQSVAQVAKEMGISLRHSRRVHREALDAVASILWKRWSETQGAMGSTLGVLPTGDICQDGFSSDLSLESEVDRISTAATRDLTTLDQAITSVLSTLSPLARNKAVELSMTVPSDLPPVAMDRTAIRQALLGLLLWALDWGEGGEVGLTASPEGQGVDVRIVAQAREEKRRQGQREEPGLEDTRLAVSQRLIQMRGGSIEVEFRGGHLAVRIWLPLGQPVTVLAVDDNPDLVGLFQRYLRGSIYHVVGARSAREAIRLAQRIRPQVITLDVMMPSQDGWEVLQLLKHHRSTCDVPIVVCSVLRERELALALGAADLLPKPTTRQQLLAALEQCRLAQGGRPGWPADNASAH